MHQYRIYCLGEGGGFRKVKEIEATGDAEAVGVARSLKHPGECEVWRGDRLIARVPPHKD